MSFGTCRVFGHLAGPKSLCPLYQPVVSSAEVSHVVAESVESQGVKSIGSKCISDTKSHVSPVLMIKQILCGEQC